MSFGFEIPNFSLVRELGMGGPAPVFLADQAGLDRQAALRILRVEHSGLAPELVQRFEQESRVLARVQHRNVVRIYQIGATDSVLFRAMEYLEAGSLLDRMRARELTPVQAVNYCAQLAHALHAVHALNAFVHELRPASILWCSVVRTPIAALSSRWNSEIGRGDPGWNFRTPWGYTTTRSPAGIHSAAIHM